MSNPEACGSIRFSVSPAEGGPIAIALSGRSAWMLNHLIEAGLMGITAADHPGARIAAYVHKLKRRGIPISTALEANRGGWTGTHARYRLACAAPRVPA